MTDDLRIAYGSALTEADRWVARVEDDDLARPTPCAAWRLGDLLAHMIGQHRGFAALFRDGACAADAYAPVPFDRTAWHRSCHELREAVAALDPDTSLVALEIAPVPLRARGLIGAILLDTVVHTWDVAASLGESFAPAPATLQLVQAVAAAIPADARTRPGAAFAPAPAQPSGPGWPRTLALVGRDAARWP